MPGLVRGWERLHQRYGKIEWPNLFKTALDLAENGHPLSRVLASALRLFQKDVSADPGCSSLYMPNGVPLNAGDLIKQPNLAETIRSIASEEALPSTRAKLQNQSVNIANNVVDFSLHQTLRVTSLNGLMSSVLTIEGTKYASCLQIHMAI